jgi:glycosyltransferase involved in cell wall biosynthesis
MDIRSKERNLNSQQPIKKLIIYLPAFNEAENIEGVIKDLPRQLNGVEQIEILVVDDGSTDETAQKAKGLDVTVISHHRNRGLGIAFRTAVKYALKNEADVVISIDADGQFDPDDIPALISPLLGDEYHMVTGNRFNSGRPDHMQWSKYWGNKQVSKIVSMVSGVKFTDVSCGFRAYTREALYHLNLFGAYSYTHEVILNLVFKGLMIAEHPIQVQYFPERKSRIASNLFAYAYNTSKIIFRSMLDYRPLFFFGNLGLLCLLIAFGFVGYLFIFYLFTGAFTPYKSFGFIGLGFGIFGLLILFIGLVADMLNRIRLNQDKILYKLNLDPDEYPKDGK